MSALGMQFVDVTCRELVGLKIGRGLAEVVGMEEKDIAALDDVKQFKALVDRWNEFAKQHRPLPNLMLYDRGPRSELLLGTRA